MTSKKKRPLNTVGRVAPPATNSSIHPDDAAHADAIHTWIHSEIRRQCAEKGLDQGQLGEAIGENRTFIRSCLSSTNLTFPIIQRIIRRLGYRLHPYLVTDGLPGWMQLPPPTQSDIALAFANNPDGSKYDEAIRVRMGEMHQAIREGLVRSVAIAAHHAGVDQRNIQAFEEASSGRGTPAHAMRLFRALGAVLRFAIEDPDTGTLYHILGTAAAAELPPTFPAVDVTDKTPVAAGVGFDRGHDNVFVWNRQNPGRILMFTSREWQEFLNTLAAAQ